MKLLILFCVLTLVGFSVAYPDLYPRGCIYVNGRCYRECEEGTHAYAVGCAYITPEATCENPNPQEDRSGMICDYSACYCDSPTVRDTAINKCVPLDQCPKTEKAEKEKPEKE